MASPADTGGSTLSRSLNSECVSAAACSELMTQFQLSEKTTKALTELLLSFEFEVLANCTINVIHLRLAHLFFSIIESEQLLFCPMVYGDINFRYLF